MDWLTRRIGANPPESMIGLQEGRTGVILAACGCPGSLIERSDGTLSEEDTGAFCIARSRLWRVSLRVS